MLQQQPGTDTVSSAASFSPAPCLLPMVTCWMCHHLFSYLLFLLLLLLHLSFLCRFFSSSPLSPSSCHINLSNPSSSSPYSSPVSTIKEHSLGVGVEGLKADLRAQLDLENYVTIQITLLLETSLFSPVKVSVLDTIRN